jgi:hypothetical protein
MNVSTLSWDLPADPRITHAGGAAKPVSSYLRAQTAAAGYLNPTHFYLSTLAKRLTRSRTTYDGTATPTDVITLWLTGPVQNLSAQTVALTTLTITGSRRGSQNLQNT